MAKTVHEGHRERMRKRYMETGFEGFQPHEVLELLLYYGVPRKDTNEMAHQLIDRFGSLHGVLSAHPAELRQVSGVTQNAAVLISLTRAVYSFDICDRLNGVVLDTYQKVCHYFAEIYQCEVKEVVRLALLDQELRVIRCVEIAEGHPTAAQMSVRRIAETMYRNNCNIAVLAHNHPLGTTKISAEDISVTRHLAAILEKSSISLVDHVIVAQGQAVSLREAGVFLGLEIE